MKNLAIRGVVLLVIALAFAVPAFASEPTEAEGRTVVTEWDFSSGRPVATVEWTGTFNGVMTHTLSAGRADMAEFVGWVDGHFGTLDMLILRTWGDAGIPGLRGDWVILSGTGGLRTLRGQGSFVLDSFDPVGGPYQGQIHFDPE